MACLGSASLENNPRPLRDERCALAARDFARSTSAFSSMRKLFAGEEKEKVVDVSLLM